MKLQIFVPVSRENRILEVVNDINNLCVGDFEVSVLFVIDNKQVNKIETKYYTKFVYTGNYFGSEFNMGTRRNRIANVFNMAREYINDNVDLVYTFEDDCEVKSDVFIRLLETYKDQKRDNIGFVSGVQAGRWSRKMIGVWRRDKNKVSSLRYERDCIKGVTSCGFYSYITKPELFKRWDYRSGFFGPDVYWGIDLVNAGFVNVCDMGVVIGHKTNQGKTLYPDGSEVELVFENVIG